MKVLILAASLAIPDSLAAPYVYPYNWMTGEEVIRKLTREPIKELDYIERDMTHHYVNGLKDGTQGTVWCFAGNILPHELNNEMALSIKGTKTAKDLKGNAAPLFLEELRRRYPCSGIKRR